MNLKKIDQERRATRNRMDCDRNEGRFAESVLRLSGQDGGCESHYGGSNDYYGWYGKQSPYYARMLWEAARRRLADAEAEVLAFDIVEASECFNTIRFKAPDRARDYCTEFRRLMWRGYGFRPLRFGQPGRADDRAVADLREAPE